MAAGMCPTVWRRNDERGFASRTPSFRLDGRSALVTGASSGIGLGAAAALAEAGAEVTLVARRRDELESVAAAIRSAGGKAVSKALDITDLDATAKFVAAAGPFDVLVNSAGMARHTPALETTPEDYDAAMNLNLRAAYFITREVARGLIQAKSPARSFRFRRKWAMSAGWIVPCIARTSTRLRA